MDETNQPTNFASSQPTEQPLPAATGKKLKVLCVEDEHFISELYTRSLTNAGYDVTAVVDGIEGLKEAQTNAYDIILLDIMIPNMTGTEILKRLKDPTQTPSFRSKVILTTNLEQGDDRRDDIEKYADGYLIKANITPRELVDYLQKLDVS
jgi:CheY-like chemotaxis protein